MGRGRSREGSLERPREVEDKPATDASGGKSTMRFGGLPRRKNLGYPKRDDALLDLASKPIEQGRVGRRSE